MHFAIKTEDLVALNAARDAKKLEQLGGVAALATALNTNLRTGLSHTEMMTSFESRKNAFGENVYPEAKMNSIFHYILEALQDTTLIILMVCAAVSLIFCVFVSEDDECLLDSIGIFVAVLLVTTVASLNNFQKERQFRALNKVKEDRKIKVVRGGNTEEVSTFNLQVGDIVKVDQGDQVSADGIFVEGFNLECDESALTGETEPLKKDTDHPFLLSGTQVCEGVGTMLVTAVGFNTEWGKTLKTIAEEESEETPLQGRLEELAQNIGYVGLTVAGLDFIILTLKYIIITAKDPDVSFGWNSVGIIMKYLVFAITIIVMAVPEGLPLAVTISLAFSQRKMLSDNNLVRHLDACETMGSATTICSDKTGTLTTNRMSVTEAWIAGVKYTQIPKQTELSEDVFNILCDCIAINSKAHVSIDSETNLPKYLGSPTECALLLMLLKNFNVDYRTIRSDAEEEIVQIYTFTSDRKRMSVVVRFEEENQARIFTKGAAEIVFGLCDRIMDSEGNIVEIDNRTREKLNQEILDMAARGLRTICLAFNDFEVKDEEELRNTEDPPERELICVAITGIKDPVRTEVPDSIEKCKQAGILVRMVTGDNIMTAKHIAQECAIYDPKEGGLAMEGKEFRVMQPDKMKEILPRLQILARSTPSDKHLLVTTLKEMGEVVAVTGDGTNDAAALKAAHVGLSMGIAGTEVAKEASDIVIMDDNFASIAKSVLWGRSVYENVRKFLQFQVTINFVALVITFVGSITDMGFPLTAVQLLWVNLIMDTFAALALATEPPSEDLMNRKPHGSEDNLFTNNMWKFIIGEGLFQIAVLLIDIYAHEAIFGKIGQTQFSKKANKEDFTLVFNLFVFCQLFNMFNARKINNEMNIFANIAKSWIFITIFFISVGVQVIICELGYYVGFGTRGLSWLEWIVCIVIGALSIPLGYILRFIPVPKHGFCGFHINLSKLNPINLLRAARGKPDTTSGGSSSFRPVVDPDLEEISNIAQNTGSR